ncbi:hypothetical protein [Pseudosporangium ferrugineum]|uniref:Uncharacterized protein n=1 Tax=Pseudosporangium ferrugineum TaxID=439699 RepID=A0A2T0SES9_9ACTN|nr:hypothetical protein [Pseudosporangium ferrugineum]PRY31919.1 hypothetical protein CLV70_102130 [Pseudosporangium ferrugineum]
MVDGLSPVAAIILLLSYPAFVLIMAGVLRMCGVSRDEIAKWALRQAYRQRVTDFVHSIRRGPSSERDQAPGDDADPG